MGTLERAIAIAAQAHTGQRDKAGRPYILHPLRVMFNVATDEARTVAVLHDLLEDTGWSADGLRAEGFSEKVIAGVEALTRRSDEGYLEFVRRTGTNPLARQVKIADLQDNLDRSRIIEPGPADEARFRRYEEALRLLDAAA